MTVSISGQQIPLAPPAEEISEEPLSLWKTAAVGESLQLVAKVLSIGASLGIGLATYVSWPLTLFAAATSLPIVYCLSIIFNDPYYEDPRKREQYRSEILALGLEKFIEKHGWEQLDRYGFLLKGSSPLITPKAYAEAFFQIPRRSDSPLLWDGLERGLFLKSDYPRIERLILPDAKELVDSGRIWQAIEGGLFSKNRKELSQELSKLFRVADGFDLLLIWGRLRDANLVPVAFPCAGWAESHCPAIESFASQIHKEREDLAIAFAQESEAFQAIAAQDKESVYRGEMDAIQSIAVTDAPEYLLLQAIEKALERQMTSAKLRYESSLEKIDELEAQERAKLEASYLESQTEHPFYFSFDRQSLQAFIETFGVQEIDRMRAHFDFPTTQDWSERFIEESDPPIRTSLERGYLNESAKHHLEKSLLEQFLNPWELFENPDFKLALENQLFNKEVLIERAAQIEPMQDPLRLLRMAFMLESYELCPVDWQIKFPWIKKLGAHFHAQEQYFDRRKEAIGSDAFLEEQRERWHREVLEAINGSIDPLAFEKDLEELSLDDFVSQYGWDFIEKTCLHPVRERFFSGFTEPKDQVHSSIFWALVALETLSQEQKDGACQYLLKDFAIALESGLIGRALESNLFDDREAFRKALPKIDPKEHRDALIRVWPNIKDLDLIPNAFLPLASWFDHSTERTLEQFDECYVDYSLRCKWERLSLIELFNCYGIEAFSGWGLNDPNLLLRWEKEDPTWSNDKWNWELLERGLLSIEKRDQWMSSWLRRHPTFREKIVLPAFWEAFNRGLFSKEHLDLIADSLHHPTTFLFASEWIEYLDQIDQLPLTLTPEEKLLYNWIKNHRSRQGGIILDREFTTYQKQVGWIGESHFDIGFETKEIVEERSHPLRKIFRGG